MSGPLVASAVDQLVKPVDEPSSRCERHYDERGDDDPDDDQRNADQPLSPAASFNGSLHDSSELVEDRSSFRNVSHRNFPGDECVAQVPYAAT